MTWACQVVRPRWSKQREDGHHEDMKSGVRLPSVCHRYCDGPLESTAMHTWPQRNCTSRCRTRTLEKAASEQKLQMIHHGMRYYYLVNWNSKVTF